MRKVISYILNDRKATGRKLDDAHFGIPDNDAIDGREKANFATDLNAIIVQEYLVSN